MIAQVRIKQPTKGVSVKPSHIYGDGYRNNSLHLKRLCALNPLCAYKTEMLHDQLRASSTIAAPAEPSPDPVARLYQLRLIKTAYEYLTPIEPSLPPEDSSLPAVLAIRDTQNCITETKSSIINSQQKLVQAKKHLEQEEADLRDARLITSALENRIDKLREYETTRSQRSPDQAARERLQEQQKRKILYDKEIRKLIRAFNDFTDKHLSAMLAAEELGGPVVGGIMGVEDDLLEVGFTTQGKAKRLRSLSSLDDRKRQRRIDEIWGRLEDSGDETTSPRSEKDAAGAEMRALTEDLLNAAADGATSSAYVELQRDSAAARFLVRARVAQFHPRDARKLRLIDFGKELIA